MMPALALIRIPRAQWLPPIPIPLVLLWPLVPLCLGIAKLLDHSRPLEAMQLRAAMKVLGELRGLSIEVDSTDHERVRIWFV